MENVEQYVRNLGKEKQVKFTKRKFINATDQKGDKHKFNTWEEAKEFIEAYKEDSPEIFSPSCSFGSDGSENVTVKLCDCPIKREIGRRIIEPHFGEDAGKTFEVTTCIYRSMYSNGLPTCPHYKGYKVVKRPVDWNGNTVVREKYKVLCGALHKKD